MAYTKKDMEHDLGIEKEYRYCNFMEEGLSAGQDIELDWKRDVEPLAKVSLEDLNDDRKTEIKGVKILFECSVDPAIPTEYKLAWRHSAFTHAIANVETLWKKISHKVPTDVVGFWAEVTVARGEHWCTVTVGRGAFSAWKALVMTKETDVTVQTKKGKIPKANSRSENQLTALYVRPDVQILQQWAHEIHAGPGAPPWTYKPEDWERI